MFGSQNNQAADNSQIPQDSIDGAMSVTPASPDPDDAPSGQAWQHPGLPTGSHENVISPVSPHPLDSPTPSHSDDSVKDSSSSSSDSGLNDLVDIKQRALGQLTPLVGHLDQSPEEKFRTTMMMIQASDDQSLVKTAYEAAQQIPDEKARAQALLDVINEINYFTSHHDNQA